MIQNKRLKIFDDGIIIDKDLPKFKITDENQTSVSVISGLSFSTIGMTEFDATGQTNIFMSSTKDIKQKKQGIRDYLIKLLSKDKKKKDFKVTDLVKFFDNIKSSVSKIEHENVKEIIDNYEFLLTLTEATGQIALKQKLKEYFFVLKNELVLSLSQFNVYLTEEDVINFYNVASKHDKYETKLKLTYIKNFVKVIPPEITLLKIKADQLLVFDNYVILHYDYLDNSVGETEEEMAKRKDPIIFGLINGSNKLYYIGDWISDYCDLTLDQIIVKLGKERSILTKDSINTEIENI